eukprot:gene30869-37302_t
MLVLLFFLIQLAVTLAHPFRLLNSRLLQHVVASQNPTACKQPEGAGEVSKLLRRACVGDAEALNQLNSSAVDDSNMNRMLAKATLMILYEEGEGGLKRNYSESARLGMTVFPYLPEKGVSLVQAAAEKGLPEAQYTLGKWLYTGYGVHHDSLSAVHWLRQAADQDYAPAQHLLAECCFYGFGQAEDEDKAKEWYTKAAQQGYAAAQYSLRRMSPFAGSEAKAWLSQAAEQGHADAQY